MSGDYIIKICPFINNEYIVSADGQIIFPLQGGFEIFKSDKKANLALLNENDFYSVLRNKLHWGISPAKI